MSLLLESEARELEGWHPQPKQKQFLLNPAFEVMYGGAKGGGKSDALLSEGTRYHKHPRYKGIIFRRTYPKLEELIDRSKWWFSGLAKWNGEHKRWTFPSGSILKFAHCQREDDKYNYQGHEYQYMGFDQIEEFTLTQYLFLLAQCRSTIPGLTPYTRSSANPCGVGHAWVKVRFIDKCPPNGRIKWFRSDINERGEEIEVETEPHAPRALSRAFIFAKLQDNKILMRLDPLYLNRLMMLPPALRRALLEGDWDAFEGQFFDEFRREIHVIPQEWFKGMLQHTNVTRFLAMDYGYRKPSSVGWYAVLPMGLIVRYRELYVEKRTYQELAEEILKLSLDDQGLVEKIDYMVADPAIWGDKQHHNKQPKDGFVKGKSGYDTMSDVLSKFFPILRADNRRLVGWTRVREYMKPFENQHGKLSAMLLVTANCRNFIRTIPGCIYDETKPEDLDTDGEDHAADEVRYGLMSRPALPEIKKENMTSAEEFWERVKADQRRSTIMDTDSETIKISDLEATSREIGG